MIVLSRSHVEALLPMRAAIGVVADTMKVVSRGGATLPLRNVIPVGNGNMMGIMPGAMGDPACYGIKLVSLFPDNPAKGLSSHRGAVILFEAETGGAVAIMDADLLTAIRTAAASAVATDALARKNAAALALIGYGEQAQHHLDSICAIRPIRSLRVAGRSKEKAGEFAAKATSGHPEIEAVAGNDVEAAVSGADIVCTVTASPTPILKGAWLEPGMHLNIVGSSVPTMREIDDDAVMRSSVWVDYLPSTLAQAGEIVEMIREGKITENYLKGEIGKVLTGELPGRRDAEQITMYRSLGIAAQDLAVAHYLVARAREEGIGQTVTL